MESGTFYGYFGKPKNQRKIFQAGGQGRKTQPVPLYSLCFRNRNELVRELYYSSVGTQKDLAAEYGLSPEEVSYIKNRNQYYTTTDKDGNPVRKKVNSGIRLKCSEDIRFYLTQIQTRPYNIYLRKESLPKTEWKDRIAMMCRLLSTRTGNHYYAEYATGPDNKEVCTVYAGDLFPVYRNAAADYPAAFAYLNSLLALTDNYKSADQRNIISSIINM